MANARILKFVLAVALAAAGYAAAFAQSTDQLFPTPVTANEVSGVIKARDVGDSRLTAYFYTFNGDQGDMFVNVVSKNFNGDIDIFVAEGLKPLSKIVVYADGTESETGRVIYLRKPEKIILRIEGRTPNDDAATFKLKFAGSFVAATDTGDQPDAPEVKPEKNNNRIQVNSVGTIIAIKPKVKPTPKPSQTAASKPVREVEPDKKPEVAASHKSDEVVETKKDAATDNPEEKKDTATTDKAAEEPKKDPGKMEVVVTDNIPETKTETPPIKKPVGTRNRRRGVAPKKQTEQAGSSTTAEAKTDESKTESSKTEEVKNEEPKAEETKTEETKNSVAKAAATRSRNRRAPKPEQPKVPDPLENIHLVIVFKDGRTIERPMSDVVRFTVDRGILTVVSKDGSIGRYAIADVLKTTIE